MSYHEDWLMRQIEALARFIAQAVFNKETVGYVIIDESNMSQTDILHRELKRLVAEGKICEAENLLHENMDVEDYNCLEMAIDFYQTVNMLGDEDLERCDFSREEVDSGLKTVLGRFGLQDFLL